MNKDLLETCLRYLDGELTEVELQAFNQLLAESPEAADLLAQLALDEHHYRTTSADNEDVLTELLALEQAAETECVEPLDPIHLVIKEQKSPLQIGGALRYLALKPAMWGALAAVLAIAVMFVVVLTSGGNPDASPPLAQDPSAPDAAEAQPVATLTAEYNAQWAEGASAPGSQLRAGQRLTLTQGFAEITTKRGAVAIIEAPATIELTDNDNGLKLHSGKLVGLCYTESSKGFVVKTDHADITDLGTEFGVTATADRAEASVFVGEILVKAPNAPAKISTQRQTARVTRDQGQAVVVVEDRLAAGYAQRLPRPALVTDVKLSVDGFEARVIPNGVYEDAKPYTDRDHELNGIDEKGIPAFLLGGDLVQLPGDARPDRTPSIEDKFAVEIELSAPANIYLLMPRPYSPLDWLVEDYERVEGVIVGSDMTQPKESGRELAIGVGPGVSIDRQYDVWKRKTPAVGRINAAGTFDRSMYVIIATPYTGPTQAVFTEQQED